jgi:Ca-activated chloride channel family protein
VLISAPDSFLGQQPAPDSNTILLRITAVDDHGRPIPDLKQEQFTVFEKKVQLPINSFEGSDEPASIVFLFDVSGSVQSRFKESVAQLAYRFAQASNKSNDYMVVAFSSRPKVLCSWGCRGDDLVKALADVAQMTPQLNTALYDACDLAINQLQASKYRKQVVFVVTDGQDNVSKNTFNNLRKKAKESSVIIYAIGMISVSDAGSSLGIEGQAVLDELASISGGKAFYPKDRKDLPDVIDSIAVELRHQYTVGINIDQAIHSNEWHPIKVRVAPVKDSNGKVLHISLRYREGIMITRPQN